MKKVKNIIQVSRYLKFLLVVFALCNLSKTTAMFSRISKPRSIVRTIKSVNDLYMDSPTSHIAFIQSVDAAKKEKEKKQNIPSMFSRIVKDPFLLEKARKSHEFMMKNGRFIITESSVKNDIDDVISLKQSLFLIHEKIINYTLQEVIGGINYLKINYPSHNIMNLFSVELVSRGYPYEIKTYENQKIAATLDQDIQKTLYVEDAVSVLRDKIISKNVADLSRIKKIAVHLPGFSFNSMAFNPHAHELLVAGRDDENNNQLILFQYNSEGVFSPINHANLKKDHINSIAIGLDGKTIAAVGGNQDFGHILLSSMDNFNEHRSIKLNVSELLSVAFRPNSNDIVALAKDFLILFNIQNSGDNYWKIKSLPDDGDFTSFAINCDGTQVVVGTSNGRVIMYSFNAENSMERKYHSIFPDFSIKAVAFGTGNNRTLAAGDSEEENIFFRKDKSHNEIETVSFKVASISALALVPGINRIIVQTGGKKSPQLILGRVFRDSDSGKHKFASIDLKSPINGISLAVSSNGAKVVVGFKGKLIVWDLLSFEEEQLLNRLGITLTKDQAHCISTIAKRLEKNNTISLLPFEVNEYHELSPEVRALLVGTHIGDYRNINEHSFFD